MLNIIIGRAGAGKTARLYHDFKSKMNQGETGLLLIVPEQYSHEAEKQLCAVCGDSLSLFGEVTSFTRMSRAVFGETCGIPEIIDKGGQMLLMHRAIESLSSKLSVYGAKAQKTDILKDLHAAIIEFKNYGISADQLLEISEKATQPLSEKLKDIALIFSAYEGLVKTIGIDTTDRLLLLAQVLDSSSIGQGHIFIDGFVDFTEQEICIVEALLVKGSDITISLTCDEESDSEIFELPQKTLRKLKSIADKHKIDVNMIKLSSTGKGRAAELDFMEKHLFDYNVNKFKNTDMGNISYMDRNNISNNSGASSCSDYSENEPKTTAISIYKARTKYAECEHAAKLITELIANGYRYRDIAIMSREWSEYSSTCEAVFEQYGLPYFSSGRDDISGKAPIAFLEAALDCVNHSWSSKNILRYIKIGFVGLDEKSCAELENYVLMWNIKGNMWEKEWTLPHRGYGYNTDIAALQKLNEVKRTVLEPLIALKRNLAAGDTVTSKLVVLYDFMTEIEFPRKLAEKAAYFEENNRDRLADEYAQLWSIIRNAMEQMHSISGALKISNIEFQKLFKLIISQYDVSVIPVALDRVLHGGMEMSRRRNLKCLILLGAVEDKLPLLKKGEGVLSDNDRMVLNMLGAEALPNLDKRINKEMNFLYSTLTQPSEKLILMFNESGGQNESYIVSRLSTMFEIDTEEVHFAVYRDYSDEVQEYLDKRRDSMSPGLAAKLYNKDFIVSASGVERYYGCSLQFFANNGLKLKSKMNESFGPTHRGLFLHKIMEKLGRELKERGSESGFANVDENVVLKLCDEEIASYIREELYCFEGKNRRFSFLFQRLSREAQTIVLDMLREFRSSDFTPEHFEFELNGTYVTSGSTANGDVVRLKGFIDRVDTWSDGDQRYIRVVDYKSGSKKFSLSDVLVGKNMQMLIYLFSLISEMEREEGLKTNAAGVLYIPVREVIALLPRSASDEEIEKKLISGFKRDGLVLDDVGVIEAMESGSSKRYLPLRLLKSGTYKGKALVSASQLRLLSRHIDETLLKAFYGIRSGKAEASPYYKDQIDNACLYCDYHAFCAFDDDLEDRKNVVYSKKTQEIWRELEERYR